jgi:hypothetical protein
MKKGRCIMSIKITFVQIAGHTLSPHEKFQGSDIAEGSAPSETYEEPASRGKSKAEINKMNRATGK